jgi:hypothetical protein
LSINTRAQIPRQYIIQCIQIFLQLGTVSGMSKWVLKCDNCNAEFTHSIISDQSAESYFLPEKPAIGDAEYECTHCGNKDTYDRSDLMYRA